MVLIRFKFCANMKTIRLDDPDIFKHAGHSLIILLKKNNKKKNYRSLYQNERADFVNGFARPMNYAAIFIKITHWRFIAHILISEFQTESNWSYLLYNLFSKNQERKKLFFTFINSNNPFLRYFRLYICIYEKKKLFFGKFKYYSKRKVEDLLNIK